jgi:hypothetical protein
MGKVIELPDEEYQMLAEAAKKRHETPEQMLRSLARALAESTGAVYYSAEEMFDALDAYAAEHDGAEHDGAERGAVRDSHSDADE